LFFAVPSFASASNATNYQVAPGSIVWKGQRYWGSSAYQEIRGYEDYLVGFRLNVPHYGQPTNNTCGATVLSMLSSYERLKSSGSFPPQPDIVELYDTLNTDNVSGLNANELKAGVVALGLFGGKSREVGSESIDEAVKDNFLIASPLIIYGNSYFGSAGGHYYAATGAIYCDDVLTQYGKCNFRGLYINDSILDSPAYPIPEPPDTSKGWSAVRDIKMIKYYMDLYRSVGAHALIPNRFYTVDELESF
jgi:hypothetical protein